MKRIYITTFLIVFFSFLLKAQQENDVFYYYFEEKMFLQQNLDKIFITFVPDANRQEISTLIESKALIQFAFEKTMDEIFVDYITLESKDGAPISFEIFEFFKTNPNILSVTYLLQNDRKFIGFTDEFIVKLHPTTSYLQLQKLAENNNCTIVRESKFVENQFVLSIPKTSRFNAVQMANLFYETELFHFSVPDFITLNLFDSNDTFFNNQWALKNTGQGVGISGIDIKAEQAWGITQGSANIKIAVIDCGVDLTHPDLQANLLSGYDATGGNSGGGPVSKNDNHGTACAGIICAIKDNQKGIAGVAPNCKLMPVYTSLKNESLREAIDWAWQNGADILSCSWGGGNSNPIVTDAIDRATTQGRGGKGCVVVFASGNEGNSVSYPAYLPNVMAVGAIDNQGSVASFSNYGNGLDVVAPGVDIYTTDRHGKKVGYTKKDYYCCFSGTSASCPHVAGIAALVLSVNPCLKQEEVRNIISLSCRKKGLGWIWITTPTPPEHSYGAWHHKGGYGLVNAYKAAQYVSDLYLQDITQTGTESYRALNSINAGKNVTTDTFEEEYIIKNGANVTFSTGNKIILSDGFIANEGAIFNAFIEPNSCNSSLLSPASEENEDEYISPIMVNGKEEVTFEEKVFYDSERFNLFPNPNSGTFQIETNFPLSEIAHLKITNILNGVAYCRSAAFQHFINASNGCENTQNLSTQGKAAILAICSLGVRACHSRFPFIFSYLHLF